MTERQTTYVCPKCKNRMEVSQEFLKKAAAIQCTQCGHLRRRSKKKAKQSLKAASTTSSSSPATDTSPARKAGPKYGPIFAGIVLSAAVTFGLVKYFSDSKTDDSPSDTSIADDDKTQESTTVAKSDEESALPEDSSLEDSDSQQTNESIERPLVSIESVYNTILDDLQNEVSKHDTLFMRYFNLTAMSNAGATDQALETTREALAKLVNSLSWGNQPFRPVAIDEQKTIYRIDLRELRWTPATWKKILRQDPYSFAFTNNNAARCADLTNESTPLVRADWFIARASSAPLYYEILDLPKDFAGLSETFAVNVARNIRNTEVVRAGMDESEETNQRRVIERHRTPYGSMWLGYDFYRSNPRGDVLRYPLGPGDRSTEFKHDAMSVAFSLPNGFQAFGLYDGNGQRIDELFAEFETHYRNEQSSMQNCLRCHTSGVETPKDDVNVAVRTDRDGFPQSEKILALFDASKLKTALAEDQMRFADALRQVELTTDSVDCVSETTSHFRRSLNFRQIAAELGVMSDELMTELKADSDLYERLKYPQTTSRITRADYANAYGSLGESLGLGRSLHRPKATTKVAVAEVNHKPVEPKKPTPTVDPPQPSPTSTQRPIVKSDLFTSSTRIIEFDGQTVRYQTPPSPTTTTPVDSLSKSDLEKVLGANPGSTPSGGDLPSDAPTKNQSPGSKGRLKEPILANGRETFVSFDGNASVTIRRQDGTTSVVPIDSLHEKDVAFVLSGGQAATATSSQAQLPGTAPAPQERPNEYTWRGVDGQPIIEGRLQSYDARRRIVRIEPTYRTWHPSGEPLNAIFYVASTSADGAIEIQLQRAGSNRSEKFPLEVLDDEDRRYMDMIRKGIESGVLKPVRSFRLKYWQIQAGDLSPEDQRRATRP